MQYQTLLLAALATFTNAAATPAEVTLSYGTLSTDLGLLADSITLTGPSSASIKAYNKAATDLTKFQVAVGDIAPGGPQHPCLPLQIGPVSTKKEANGYVKRAEDLITRDYKETLQTGGGAGVYLCEASQLLSFVGQYVGAF